MIDFIVGVIKWGLYLLAFLGALRLLEHSPLMFFVFCCIFALLYIAGLLRDMNKLLREERDRAQR